MVRPDDDDEEAEVSCWLVEVPVGSALSSGLSCVLCLSSSSPKNVSLSVMAPPLLVFVDVSLVMVALFSLFVVALLLLLLL